MNEPLGEERRVGGEAVLSAPGDALLVSRHEAARLLGVGQTTIDAMIRSKAIRTVRISRRRLVIRASIYEYIARLEGTP